jgi:hypothetical protein
MMITNHPHMKSTIILKFWYLKFLEFQNIISKFSNFKSKWVIMCITYEQSFGL